MWYRLVNGLVFNACWLLVVANQSALLAWTVALLVVAGHLAWFGRGWPEVKLVLAVAAGGYLLDQLLFATGLLRTGEVSGAAPLWLSALWPLFAMTLLHAFSALARYPLLAGALGGIAGYASYRLGAAMTAIDFGPSPVTDIALVLLWAALFPLLLVLAARMAAGAPRGASHAH